MAHTNSTANYNLPQFLGTDKPAWLTDINDAFYNIDAALKANADAALPANILDAMHPVGSEYVTTTATAPTIGGTWVLVEKELTQVRGSTLPSTAYTNAGTNVVDSVVMRRESSAVELRVTMSNVVVGESYNTLCNINPDACGITQFGGGQHNFTVYSDTGNVLLSLVMDPNGDLSCNDAWKFAANAYPANSYEGGLSAFTIIIPITTQDMLNSACDRFIWQRTA